jgi:peptidyl-prolyl cis-trans isomerase B (cyclophilin B)
VDRDTPVAEAVAEVIGIGLGKDMGRLPLCPEPPNIVVSGPMQVVMLMASGDQVVLELRGDEAPGTVQKFLNRVSNRGDRFASTVLHRLLPNALLQGGSADGSDWTGAPLDITRRSPGPTPNKGICRYRALSPTFWPDEFNPLRHERGAVALATNGPGTGIGQFFIDLVDVPAFNHEYTVFGRVICVRPARAMMFVTGDPMDLIDQFQEGEKIQQIQIPPRRIDLSSFKCAAGVQ